MCIVLHLLVFGISPTLSGLTGLHFGLHKQSETGSVWSGVFTDTCSHKHTLIPHVVVYRPCFHSQQIGSNIYSWTHVCLQRICVDRVIYLSHILFNYIFKLQLPIINLAMPFTPIFYNMNWRKPSGMHIKSCLM